MVGLRDGHDVFERLVRVPRTNGGAGTWPSGSEIRHHAVCMSTRGQ